MGHGRLNDPTLNVNGTYKKHQGYMTDVLNQFAEDFLSRKHERPRSVLRPQERSGALDDTVIVFFGDNGYFFGEHGLGPERRFPYEEGIRSPFLVRYPRRIKARARLRELVIWDIAPILIELAGGKPGQQIQGRSLLPLFFGRRTSWRKSFLIEYWAENAMPWLVGMTYKAVRTDRHNVHPLGQQGSRPRARRVVRSRHRSVRTAQSEQEPIPRRFPREAPPRVGAARGRSSGHLDCPGH